MRILTASERVDRAFATLGLRPDVSAEKAQQEYRRLVRRWHPDRYAGDPQGHAEASLRMRQINAAFDVIRPLLQPELHPSNAAPAPPVTPVETPQREPREFGSRLPPESVEAIVGTLRPSSDFEILFAYAARGGWLVGGITLLGIGSGHHKPFDVVFGCLLVVLALASMLAAAWRGRRRRAAAGACAGARVVH